MQKALTHNRRGNCYQNKCRRCDGFCDVCHAHDEPRGGCSVCPRCKLCEVEDMSGMLRTFVKAMEEKQVCDISY